MKKNDATNLTSSEVPDTNSIDSSMNMNIVDDQEKKMSTPEDKKSFLKSEIPEVIPSNARHTGSSQNSVKNSAEPLLNVTDNVPSSVNSSADDNATENKQLQISSKSEETTVKVKEKVLSSFKASAVENNVKFRPFKGHKNNGIDENVKVSNTCKVADINSINSSNNINAVGNETLNQTTKLNTIESKQSVRQRDLPEITPVEFSTSKLQNGVKENAGIFFGETDTSKNTGVNFVRGMESKC